MYGKNFILVSKKKNFPKKQGKKNRKRAQDYHEKY